VLVLTAAMATFTLAAPDAPGMRGSSWSWPGRR
jgi:hypothetical protein